ncbi:MAG TPA: hypothetical protein EYP80_02535 [Candidatus Aenigmarchaeota archaeon]|nr:hypothetical protein [Candidatus Aenigmarchaeota archaeon]
MEALSFLKEAEKYPLLNYRDLERILGKKKNYLKVYVNRLKNKNLIKAISKGIFTVYKDPLIFANYLEIPSYFSLWTALRYYNFTTQLPKDYFLICTRYKKPIKFEHSKIYFLETKYFFGFKKVKYKGFDVFISEPEKLVIDSLLNFLPLSEILNVITSCKKKKLVDYTLRIKNKSLIKRVGFLLERTGFFSKQLNKEIDHVYIPLNPKTKKKGLKNKKWKILINEKI